MQKTKVIGSLLLPYGVLVILWMLQKTILEAQRSYTMGNYLILLLLLGFALGISIYLISTLNLTSHVEFVIFLVNTILWIALAVYAFFYQGNLMFVLALTNRIEIVVAITVVNVMKMLTYFRKSHQPPVEKHWV